MVPENESPVGSIMADVVRVVGLMMPQIRLPHILLYQARRRVREDRDMVMLCAIFGTCILLLFCAYLMVGP